MILDSVKDCQQMDSRGTSGKLKSIAVDVYSNNCKGLRVTHRRTGPLVCSHQATFSSVREVTLVFQPRKEPFTVLISAFFPKEETKFAISVHSSAPITFEVARSRQRNKQCAPAVTAPTPPFRDLLSAACSKFKPCSFFFSDFLVTRFTAGWAAKIEWKRVWIRSCV